MTLTNKTGNLVLPFYFLYLFHVFYLIRPWASSWACCGGACWELCRPGFHSHAQRKKQPLLLQAGGHLSWGHYQPPSWNQKRFLKGLSHAICFLLKRQKLSSHQLNSKNNGPDQFRYLRLRYIVTTDGKDGHDWKSKKSSQLFQVLILCPQKKSSQVFAWITALFTNMQIVKFKSQLTIAFFAAVNHLNGPLRKQNFTLKGSKGHGLWLVIGGFRSVLCVSVFQDSLLVIVIDLFTDTAAILN